MSGELHPIVRDAAAGIFPEWTRAGRRRRRHMERVASLMREWATERGESHETIARWVASGILHDTLREADPQKLRGKVARRFRDCPGAVLHGPAAARRLKKAGVEDQELLDAIAYHTLGSDALSPLGRALYAADFLDPKRRLRPKWRAKLRGRMPVELDDVVRDIVGARILHLIKKNQRLRYETVAMWNQLLGDEE